MPAAFEFEAIGTKWKITILNTVRDNELDKIKSKIAGLTEDFDKSYSRFRQESWVSAIAQAPGKYDMPRDGFKLIDFYSLLYKKTNGLVTPLIGSLMSAAGYDKNYSFEPKELVAPKNWGDTIEYDEDFITLKSPATLDFGAAGKGYLVDIISNAIETAGVNNYVIDASGDILHRGSVDIEIGLENPLNTNEALGIVALKNKSLCASSGAKRKWLNFTHIINPHSLQSPTEILATWVIATETMIADGLATALFFVEPQALNDWDFDYAILRSNMSLERSSKFPVKTFDIR